MRVSPTGEYLIVSRSSVKKYKDFVFVGEYLSNAIIEYDIQPTADGGFVAVGVTLDGAVSFSESETASGEKIDIGASTRSAVITKLNEEGKVEWVSTLPAYDFDSILINKNNNEYIVTGKSISTTIEAEKMESGESVTLESSPTSIKYNSEGKIVELYTNGPSGRGSRKSKTIDEGIIQLSTTAIKKYNSNVELEWSKALSLTGVTFNNVKQVSDNGYVAVGYFTKNVTISSEYTSKSEEISLTNNGGNDGLIIKFTEDGLIEWAKSLGTMPKDEITGIAETNPNEYTVTANLGTITSVNINQNEEIIYGASIVTYNNTGEIINTVFRFDSKQTYNDVTRTSDGGSIAVGNFLGKLEVKEEQTIQKVPIEINSNGAEDNLIVKYNKNGLIEWIDSLGGAYTDNYLSVLEVDDGYLAVGYFGSSGGGSVVIQAEKTVNQSEMILTSEGNSDGIIVKYTEDGKIEWIKQLGRQSSDTLKTITKTFDGGYIVGGTFLNTITIPSEETADGNVITKSSNGNNYPDGIIIKYSNKDLVEWVTTIGGTSGENIYEVVEDNGTIAVLADTIGVISFTTISGEEITIEGSTWYRTTLILTLDSEGNIVHVLSIKGNHPSVVGTGIDIKGDEVIATGSIYSGITIPAEKTVANEEIELTSKGAWSSWILRINGDGLVEKMFLIKTLNGGLNGESGILDVKFTEDNGYAIIGKAGTSGNSVTIAGSATTSGENITISGNNYAFFYKYNHSDLIEWVKTYDIAKFESVSINENYECIVVGSLTKNGVPTALITKYTEETLSPEVPAQEIVNVLNTKKAFIIKAEVEGTGGTVSIGENKSGEIVKYKEDSIEDIVITPEENYQISSITINGESISFTPDENGVVTLEKFSEMVSDKNIVVTFAKTEESANVIVHHYLWEEGAGTTTKLAEDDYITGELGTSYTTAPKVDLEGYNIITNKDYYGEDSLEPDEYYIPENATGEIEETIEVTYYYKAQTYSVTVHHYLEGTNEAVPLKGSTIGEKVEDEILEGYAKGEEYETSQALENLIDYTIYELVEIPENSKGIIKENTEVIYYYKIKITDLRLTKVAEEDHSITISGTKFALYQSTSSDTNDEKIDIENIGTDWKLVDTYTSSSKGVVKLIGLPITSEYRLVETKASEGRIVPDGQWKIEIIYEAYDESDSSIIEVDGTRLRITAIGNPPALTISEEGKLLLPNKKYFDFPTSGNIGTDKFYQVGIVIIFSGLVLLMMRKGSILKSKKNTRYKRKH